MNVVSWKRAADLEPGDVIDWPSAHPTATTAQCVVSGVDVAPGLVSPFVTVRFHVGHDGHEYGAIALPERRIIVYLPPAEDEAPPPRARARRAAT